MKPESGYASERRLREAVKDAALGALATDDADRERLDAMFELIADYNGRSPFTAAVEAHQRGDAAAVARALADDRRIETLAQAGKNRKS